MRIIAGSARGRRIDAPEGMDTRPTLDRVKESVFGSIQFEIVGRRVLDLFAGSGNLGIEALSRGAEFACFCDVNRICTDLIKSNLALLRFENGAVYNCSFESMLEKCRKDGERFGLVFLDPPYASGLAQDAVDKLCEFDLLTEDAIICCEHAKTQTVVIPDGLCERSRKIYRDTAVTMLEKKH